MLHTDGFVNAAPVFPLLSFNRFFGTVFKHRALLGHHRLPSRGGARHLTFPIKVCMTVRVSASEILPKATGRSFRVSGASVVSASCSAFISPKPLKREMESCSSVNPSFLRLQRARQFALVQTIDLAIGFCGLSSAHQRERAAAWRHT